MSAALRWALILTALLTLILGPFLLFEEPIVRWFEQFVGSPRSRAWIASAVIGALALDVFAPIPSSLIGTAAGYLLGLLPGTAAAWCGMTAGAVVGYWAGRGWGRPAVEKFAGAREAARVERLERRFGSAFLIVCRSVPVLAEASVLMAGVARMPFWRFLVLVALANFAISLAYAAVGALALETSSFLLAFAGAVLLPGIALLFSRRLRSGGMLGP